MIRNLTQTIGVSVFDLSSRRCVHHFLLQDRDYTPIQATSSLIDKAFEKLRTIR
jgi:hypothetical protein